MKTTATTTYHLDGATLKKQNKKYNNTQNTKRKQNNKHSELNCHHDVPPGWSKNYLRNTHTSKHSITQSTGEKYKHIKRKAGEK